MDKKSPEIIYRMFDNINQWLFHAEKKNAMLVAFNGVSIFGLLSLMNADLLINSILIWIFRVSIFMMLISLVISLSSFVPQLKLKISTGKRKHQSNLWYFNHIQYLNVDEYLRKLEIESPSKVEIDLAEQIIQNARIASNKYFLFEVAVWFCLAAYITPVMAVILLVYNKIN